MVHVLPRSFFAHMLGRSPPVLCPMDTILEGLRRDELVWLNTNLTGRLRALPPPATASTPVQLPSTPPCPTTATDPGGELPATALAERVGDFPWERTGAAPQGWASHLHQSVLPVQGYILPARTGCEPADSVSAAPCRVGRASPSVSIFARAPVCPDTCRYCRCKPCDVATVHDDHTCYNCEQRQLFPERIPKWEVPDLPICDSWCQACATQRCCSRGAHASHFCMRCMIFLFCVGVILYTKLNSRFPCYWIFLA